MMEHTSIRELTDQEVEQVAGGIDIGVQIGSQLGLISIGVGVLVAGATATIPVWIAPALVITSIAITAGHVSSGPSDGSNDS